MDSPEPVSPSCGYRFDRFELDARSGELREGARRLRLPPKPFEVLHALVQRPGEVVTREELRRRLWGDDTFVDFDNNLNTAVRTVREVLGETAGASRFIETLPKRGYRFLAAVQPLTVSVAAPARDSFRRALRAALPIVLAASVLALAVPVLRSLVAARATEVRLAVLPFEDLAPRVEASFGAGLTDDLIAALGRMLPERFSVLAPTSSRRAGGPGRSVPEIARELRADYLVRGSVRVADGRTRIVAHLIRAADGRALWTETYDRGVEEVLAVQSDLAARIAQSLSLRLRPRHVHAVPREAYEALLEGRYLLEKGGPCAREAY